ncbi:hypothetical protein B0H13DRAFT_1867516 [Mycena leptocephala]|nr:hypothetical protein B0H13DRAFT_1867516 [Mycena leptocephala]
MIGCYLMEIVYRLCIDDLEQLVLKRMFELTKMNTSGIGYKMRNPIVKTLQARSQAIRNALNWYNTAAAALNPPQRLLAWDKIQMQTLRSIRGLPQQPGLCLTCTSGWNGHRKRWSILMSRYVDAKTDADTLGPKFTGILMPGIRAVELLASEEMDEGRGADSEPDWNFDVGEDGREDGWEDDEDEELEEEELAEMLETVLTLATNGVNLPNTDE